MDLESSVSKSQVCLTDYYSVCEKEMFGTPSYISLDTKEGYDETLMKINMKKETNKNFPFVKRNVTKRPYLPGI